jgi:translation initiation factor IF-3
VLDKAGSSLGDMATTEGINLAKSRGLDLVLVDFHVDPPVCQITDSFSFPTHEPLDFGQGYSFDPALRVSTIRFSSNIDDLEFERKIDILRKHLLEKRRCEVVVYSKSSTETIDQKTNVLKKILREVKELAKSPDLVGDIQDSSEIIIRVWPCNPEQVEPLEASSLSIEPSDSDDHLQSERKGHPRKFRTIRARPDPRLSPRGSLSEKSKPDESD